MIVVWVVGVVGVVELVRLPEVHLVHEMALSEERQCAIDRCAGDGAGFVSCPLKQLFGGEMFISGEYRVDYDTTLIGDAKILFLEEIHEFPLRLLSHYRLHGVNCCPELKLSQ